jgi:hypothetical protein
MKISLRTSRTLQRSIIIFPAIAIAVSVGCIGPSHATVNPLAKKTTTTVKKKKVVPTTTAVVKGVSDNPTALFVLGTIVVQKEYASGYNRSLFKHWIDANNNGCDTREEVLIAESLSKPQIDAYGCKVIEGDWRSPYDNVVHTNPSGLDIDHMVPLKEAWDSGAWAWSSAQRQSFANDLSDPRSLIAVTAGQNRSKSDKDPSNWIPPQSSYRCIYLSEWVAIKSHWKLSMDQSEFGRIKNLLTASCATTTIAPWGSSAVTTTIPTGGMVAPITGVVDTTVSQPTVPAVTSTSAPVSTPGALQVNPVRCKKAEFGLTGEYKGVPYVCSDHRKDGSAYAVGYYMWRPA